jgi:hypothetical protein
MYNGVMYNEWLGQYTTLDSNIFIMKKVRVTLVPILVTKLAFGKFIGKLIVDNNQIEG